MDILVGAGFVGAQFIHFIHARALRSDPQARLLRVASITPANVDFRCDATAMKGLEVSP